MQRQSVATSAFEISPEFRSASSAAVASMMSSRVRTPLEKIAKVFSLPTLLGRSLSCVFNIFVFHSFLVQTTTLACSTPRWEETTMSLPLLCVCSRIMGWQGLRRAAQCAGMSSRAGGKLYQGLNNRAGRLAVTDAGCAVQTAWTTLTGFDYVKACNNRVITASRQCLTR